MAQPSSAAGTRVSVVIPVYNGAKVLARAVNSVLAQTHAAHEIILVDDGSTDATATVIAELARQHPAVKPLILEQNGGVSRARNRGNAIATGEWIAMLDGDDKWRPNRLERMLAIAREHDSNYVLDNMMIHDLNAGSDVRVMMAPAWDVLAVDPKTYWHNCRLGAPQFSILKMLVSRSFLETSGLKYDELCGNGQDLIYHGDALALGARVVVTREPLYVYSARFGDLSKQKNRESRTNMNFAGIADRIDALRARHSDRMSPEVDAAAQLCSTSFRTGHRLNLYRGARRQGQIGGWLKLAADPKGLLLTLRMQYRKRAVKSSRYAAASWL